jgi:hypothetical protein
MDILNRQGLVTWKTLKSPICFTNIHCNFPFINISPGLIRSIAKLGNVFHLPLTTERLNKLTESYIVDNTKIKQALGKELPVGARDGILKTIRSFR